MYVRMYVYMYVCVYVCMYIMQQCIHILIQDLKTIKPEI